MKQLKNLLVCVFTLVICQQLTSQTLPNLGTAAYFGVLSGSRFYAVDTVTVKEKIGSISGNLNIAKSSVRVSGSGTVMTTALTDLGNAKTSLSAQTGSAISSTITNQSISAGVYTVTANTLVTGNIKLTGDTNSIFIFNVVGDLTFNSAFFNMTKNTVLPSKIFWNVSGKVRIKGINKIMGTILAQGKITVSNYDAGSVSLLSQDSINIFNIGKSKNPGYLNSSTFYSQKNMNSGTLVLPTTPNCTAAPDNCNMISNPSFEDITPSAWNTPQCPYGKNQIDFACDWYKYFLAGPGLCCIEPNFGYPMYGDLSIYPGYSINEFADYFSTCGSGDHWLPDNYYTNYTFGNSADDQMPHTGDGYAGIKLRHSHMKTFNDNDPTPNVDDPASYTNHLMDNVLKKKLPSTLVANKVYYMEFYSNLANVSNKSAQLAVYPMYEGGGGFSDYPLYTSPPPPPLFTSVNPIPDDGAWHKVSSCFSTSATNVDYLAIKTFVDPNITDGGIVAATSYDPSLYSSYPLTGTNAGTYWMAYFFIDDVMLRPLADAGPDKSLSCAGSTSIGINCAPIAGAVYAWTPTNSFTSSNSTITSPGSINTNVTLNIGGVYVYDLTVTLNGCTATDQVTVTVNSPSITATASPSVICTGSSTTLTATGATSYTWNPGGLTGNPVTVTPSVTTVYTVTGTSGSCTGTKTVQVIVKPMYCCQSPSFSIGSATTTTNYSNNSNGSGAVVDVLGSITFTANSSMTNYILRMAPTATININSGVTVTFSNCTIYSCTDLWGGILIADGVGVPGIVNVINSRIEDMYLGITHSGASGSATGDFDFIKVTNSVLNNNYVSIHLRNRPKANATAFREGLSVTGTTITSQPSSTSPQTTLKPSTAYTYAYNNILNTSITYTNFPRGFAGIYLYNLEEIPVIIGDSTGTGGTNRFENLDFGVYAENASPKAFNNHFINITGSTKQFQSRFPPPPPPAGPDEIGVAFNAITTAASQIYYVRVGKVNASIPTGGNPFPGGNKFENCGKGIAISNYTEPYVNGNLFTASVTDVTPVLVPSDLYSYYKAQNAVYIKNIVSNATIKNNYILNQATGIYTSHNIDTRFSFSKFIKIEDNLIESPATNGYCRQAIQTDQPASTTNLGTGLLTVKNNTIQNVYNGIKALNVKAGLQVNSNPTIKIDVAKTYGITGVSQTQINTYARTGILASGCVDAVIANNPNIIGNGTVNSTYYTYVKGIWMNGSTGTAGQVNCNVISNVGRCMQFSSTSLNKVAKNVMNGTYQGFVLSSNGQIGDQGRSTNTTHDNEWSSFTGGSAQYAETYTESSGNNANTNSRFYVKSGSPYQPTQNYSTATPYQTGLNLGIDIQTGLSGESCLSLRVMGGNNEAMAMRTAQNNDSTNTSVYEALASDTTFYEVYQNEIQYRNQQLVYELLNSSSIDTTHTLNEFYNAHQNSNYQSIVNFNEAVANANYQMAQSINDGLTTNNAIETYQKRVNELLLKYLIYQPQYDTTQLIPIVLNPVFDGTELIDLMTIANSCLDKYGNVITQARALVNNVSNRIIEFNENCIPEYNQRKSTTTKTANNNSTVNVRLFPNPNKGVMTLEYDLGAEPKGEMRIFDINGKLVNVYSLQSSIGKLEINQQYLTNGVYYYSIILDGNVSKTDKIIIIK